MSCVEKIYNDNAWNLSGSIEAQYETWNWQIHENGEDADTLGAGEGIRIAIIGNRGVRYTHEVLAGQVDLELSVDLTGRYGVWEGYTAGANYTLMTALSGIIAAKDNEYGIKGVAHSAQIVVVRSYGTNEEGMYFGHIEALEYCLSIASSIDVLVTPGMYRRSYVAEEEALFDALAEAGVICLAPVSTPMDPRYSEYVYPAGYSSVVGVGGAGPYFTKDAKCDERYLYSDWGDHVDFVAAGFGMAPHHDTDSMYYPATMTSTACANAAAVFAILKARYPDFTRDEIVEVARATAINNTTYYNEHRPDNPQTYRDPYHGYGFLTVGGPVEWDEPESAFLCPDIVMPMVLSGGASVPFYQSVPFEMTLSGSMDFTRVILNLIFEMNLSGTVDAKRILAKKILRLLNTIKTGGTINLVNSLQLDISMALRVVNHLMQDVRSQLRLKLDLESLAKLQKTLRLANRLRDAGATFGEFYFDGDHDG